MENLQVTDKKPIPKKFQAWPESEIVNNALKKYLKFSGLDL